MDIIAIIYVHNILPQYITIIYYHNISHFQNQQGHMSLPGPRAVPWEEKSPRHELERRQQGGASSP